MHVGYQIMLRKCEIEARRETAEMAVHTEYSIRAGMTDKIS